MLALMFPSPVPSPPSSSRRLPPAARPSRKRPRGLWKQRRVQAKQAAQAEPRPYQPWPNKASLSHDRIAEWRRAHSLDLDLQPAHPDILLHSPAPSSASSSRRSLPDLDDEDDEDDARSASSSSSKRRRRSGHFTSDSDLTPSPASGYAPTSSITALSLSPSRNAPYHPRAQLVMSLADLNHPHHPSVSLGPSASVSIISSPRAKGKQVRSADYEDWENLKALFARAAERYDADDIPEALPLLRAVIRECHRFLLDHPDPSVVYADPAQNRTSRSPGTITPTEERLSRDWGMDAESSGSPHWSHRRKSSARTTELPTAFHAIFGITLFLMGNLVAQDPSLVLPGEPDVPSTYWLAALDVFETGENLPSRTGGTSLDTAEDWRMAIVWGRTLVCLADEKVTYNMKKAKEQADASSASGAAGEYCYYPSGSSFSMAEPKWSAGSPFHAIAQFRPPVTRRMSLYSASAHDIMVLAMDQFSRGIFHMPHPHYAPSHNPSFIHTPGASGAPAQSGGYFSGACAPAGHYGSPASDASSHSPYTLPFSRPKELFTIASEVLGVAERLTSGTQRHYWASWADSVFNQMKNEADMDAWRGPILSARGRCWLVMGSAPVEDMEAALEAGHTEVLHSAEAEEAREGLAMAISFFERAKGQAALAVAPAGELRGLGGGAADDVAPLLVEALLVLANLTADENKREELYTRAQTEAGEELRLELDLDGTIAASRAAKEDEPMDVS